MKLSELFKKLRNTVTSEDYDPTFLLMLSSKEERMRNEKELDQMYYKNERNRYMEKMMLEFLKEVLMYEESDLLNSDFYSFYKCIRDDLILKARNQNLDDKMHYIGEGYSVICYQIGDNIMTIGRYKNHNINLKPDERFLNLKLNRSFPTNNIYREPITIQVMDRVNTKKISNDDVYYLYRHFREKGIVWLDPKNDNVGRLIKPNQNPYPGITKEGRDYLGILECTSKEYNKGELVVFDIDGFIPEEELEKLAWAIKDSVLLKKYETRYQKELLKKKKNI